MTKNFLFGFLSSILLIGLVACGQPAVGKAVGDSGSAEALSQSSGLEDSTPKAETKKSPSNKSEIKTLANASEGP